MILKNIEDFLAREWTKSLTETCIILCIKNPLVELIPREMKCEDYCM